MRYCALCHKKAASGNSTFFGVPQDPRRREKWSKICQKEFTNKNCICIDHFSKDDILSSGKRFLLMPKAVPIVRQQNEAMQSSDMLIDGLEYSCTMNLEQPTKSPQGLRLFTIEELAYTSPIKSSEEFQKEKEYQTEHDLQVYANHTPKHKMTTLKQYSLLKRKMASLLQIRQNCYKNNNANGILRYKQDNKYWNELTEELNSLGPPYRTVQQWKKVWCDFKRGQKKRSGKKSTHKSGQHTETEPNYYNDTNEMETNIKTELEDCEQNSPSMYTAFSNKYDNDYSYPDEEDSLQESCLDDKDTFLRDESSCSSYTYFNRSELDRSSDQPSSNKHFVSPPPLHRPNVPMQDPTLYTLHNQMEHHTKFLEHLSQLSTTMISLMERQTDAIEKKTEIMKRQALATEQHTSAMNRFIDMVRDKMFETNSQKKTSSTENSTN